MPKQTEKKVPETKEATPIIKELEPVKETKVTIKLPVVLVGLSIIIAGVFTGYVLAQSGGGKVGGSLSNAGKTKEGLAKAVGVEDTATFKDSAEGMLREGGVDNEGSHHLERPGGPSQDVYLTSSTVPLDDYVGKKVKVFGQTFAAQKAGWFMDVGLVKILE